MFKLKSRFVHICHSFAQKRLFIRDSTHIIHSVRFRKRIFRLHICIFAVQLNIFVHFH